MTFTIVDPGAMLIDCPGGCPTGWQYLNSKCYKVLIHFHCLSLKVQLQKFDAAVTYAGATSACAAQGAELVTIDSFDENDALRSKYNSEYLEHSDMYLEFRSI